jgi:hypothetical protein
MGRPRRRPSSCGMLDEGWSLPVVLSPLVQRDWRRHRAKGSVFAFAPTTSLGINSTSPAGIKTLALGVSVSKATSWFEARAAAMQSKCGGEDPTWTSMEV